MTKSEEAAALPAYIAVIHKSPSRFGVSFPDLPGIATAAGTLDEVLAKEEGRTNSQ